jgi:signal peptidase I
MLVRWLGGGLLALFAIGVFASQPEFKRYRVPSESMEPTIEKGDIVNLDRGADPKVGDIVIFHPTSTVGESRCATAPADGEPCAATTDQPDAVEFIKRIVAGPGDRIAFREGGHAVLNGKRVEEPYIAPCPRGNEGCDFPNEITVPAGTYYLAGDNRGASDDSRFWGAVRRAWILGRADRCKVAYFFCSAI